MKSNGIKNIHRSKLYQCHTPRNKRAFAAATFKGLWVANKTCGVLWFVRGKFSFLNVNIWFDVITCKFIVRNSTLKCWLCFRLFLWRTQKLFPVIILSFLSNVSVFDYSLQHKVRLCEKHVLCCPFFAVKVFCLTSLDSILLYL